MKHYFIINPAAGQRDKSDEYIKHIEEIFAGRDEPYRISLTGHAGHATKLARAAAETGEQLRIYSLGGDGTLHEVVCGCWDCPNVELAAFPAGTGNDFIKSFPDSDFTQLEALVNGTARTIDMMKFNDSVCINIVNCGFDAEVAKNVQKFKKTFSGNAAYYVSLFFSFIKPICSEMKIEVDDVVAYEGKATICAIANGRVYGGGFIAGPNAQTDDGLLDIVIAKGMSRLKITSFVDKYKKGRHDELGDLVISLRGKKIRITSAKPFAICGDGECFTGTECMTEVMPMSVKVVIPAAPAAADDSEKQSAVKA